MAVPSHCAENLKLSDSPRARAHTRPIQKKKEKEQKLAAVMKRRKIDREATESGGNNGIERDGQANDICCDS